jgi:NAD(P)-dependent dehydrogenase (short-subunit alcohol dehydrogenase family)
VIDLAERGAASTAIVTGAASGIGRATAHHLAKADYHVALIDIDEPGLHRTRAEILSAGGQAKAFRADVGDAHELGAVVRAVLTTMGSPELLVNVAGIELSATVLDTSDEDWARVIGTNLTGPFLLTRAVLPLMLDRGSGVIVNVASVAGAVGIPARAAYCASKAGLVGLTRAIAADHAGDGIRCVALCPGTVETAWLEGMSEVRPDPDVARELLTARQLDGRPGAPDEVAATIAFIAGPGGRLFNGAAVVVDGGMTAVYRHGGSFEPARRTIREPTH